MNHSHLSFHSLKSSKIAGKEYGQWYSWSVWNLFLYRNALFCLPNVSSNIKIQVLSNHLKNDRTKLSTCFFPTQKRPSVSNYKYHCIKKKNCFKIYQNSVHVGCRKRYLNKLTWKTEMGEKIFQIRKEFGTNFR